MFVMPLKECSKVRKHIGLPSSHLAIPYSCLSQRDSPVIYASESPCGDACTAFKTVAHYGEATISCSSRRPILFSKQQAKDCHSIRMNVQLFLPTSVQKSPPYNAKSQLGFSYQKYVIAAEHVGIQEHSRFP